MEPNNNEPEKKKVNEDLVVFMRKRSNHERPRYTARALKTYVDLQRKRRRAANARRLSDHNCIHDKKGSTSPLGRKKSGKNDDQKDKVENSEHPASEDGRMSRSLSSMTPGMKLADFSNNLEPIHRRGGGNTDDKTIRARSFSRSRSDEPSEACCRRRRRRKKCRRRRRRRSCRRRRRRRRSCRRRRRRRRSCSRRRRRRSCRRRRRRRRRSCRRRRRRC